MIIKGTLDYARSEMERAALSCSHFAHVPAQMICEAVSKGSYTRNARVSDKIGTVECANTDWVIKLANQFGVLCPICLCPCGYPYGEAKDTSAVRLLDYEYGLDVLVDGKLKPFLQLQAHRSCWEIASGGPSYMQEAERVKWLAGVLRKKYANGDFWDRIRQAPCLRFNPRRYTPESPLELGDQVYRCREYGEALPDFQPSPELSKWLS